MGAPEACTSSRVAELDCASCRRGSLGYSATRAQRGPQTPWSGPIGSSSQACLGLYSSSPGPWAWLLTGPHGNLYVFVMLSRALASSFPPLELKVVRERTSSQRTHHCRCPVPLPIPIRLKPTFQSYIHVSSCHVHLNYSLSCSACGLLPATPAYLPASA